MAVEGILGVVPTSTDTAAPAKSLKRKRNAGKDTADKPKKQRRRHAELTALPEAPSDSEADETEAGAEAGAGPGVIEALPAGVIADPSPSNPTNTDGAATSPPKKKKRQRGKTPAQRAAAAAADPNNPDADAKEEKSNRFIAFIGNLPYDTTSSSLARHFSSIHPDKIRHMTEKENWNDPSTSKTARERNSGGAPSKEPKSKGYAFVEFSSYDRLLSCLKLYHHSFFSVDEGGKGSSRRINVELTAGGGGTGEGRKEKLKVKNERLAEERKREYKKDKEKKEKERREKKGATGANAGGLGEGGKGEGGKTDKAPAEAGVTADVHPERMRMLDAGGRGGGGSGGRGRGGRGGRGGGSSRGRGSGANRGAVRGGNSRGAPRRGGRGRF